RDRRAPRARHRAPRAVPCGAERRADLPAARPRARPRRRPRAARVGRRRLRRGRARALRAGQGLRPPGGGAARTGRGRAVGARRARRRRARAHGAGGPGQRARRARAPARHRRHVGRCSRARRRRRAGGALALGAAPADAAEPYERLAAIVHVHSDLSTGEFPLEELTDMAERQGLSAVLVTENYLNRVEYSLPPFRALARVTYESRSVHGRLDEYFARVAQARAARPRVPVLPGVEVMPHYSSTGSPFSLALTLHGTQTNLPIW